MEVAPPGQEVAYNGLILLRREGARRVKQPAAGPHQVGGHGRHAALSPGASGDDGRTPLNAFQAAEHRLAGAGGIDEHAVEHRPEGRRQPSRLLVGHQDVDRTPAGQIVGQQAGAPGVNVIGDQQAVVVQGAPQRGTAAGRGQTRGQMRRLAARRGGQIEDEFPWCGG